jgi:hypothetical protein
VPEPFDINLMTKLWVTISNNALFKQQLNEYLKLVEIVVLSMFRSIQDEQTFSTLAFMKDKLHDQVGFTFGHNCLHVCTKVLYLKKLLLSRGYYSLER